MNAKSPIRVLGLALLVVGGPAVAADAWTCTNGDLERNVTIYYPQAPQRVPCEVYYSKRDEHVIPRVLWDAQRDAGYCEARATAFVTRLESLGWHCVGDDGGTDTAAGRK